MNSTACCPECHSCELHVYSTQVCIKMHADGSWDIETPFTFDDDDEAYCDDCDWSGAYGDCTRAAEDFYGKAEVL